MRTFWLAADRACRALWGMPSTDAIGHVIGAVSAAKVAAVIRGADMEVARDEALQAGLRACGDEFERDWLRRVWKDIR